MQSILRQKTCFYIIVNLAPTPLMQPDYYKMIQLLFFRIAKAMSIRLSDNLNRKNVRIIIYFVVIFGMLSYYKACANKLFVYVFIFLNRSFMNFHEKNLSAANIHIHNTLYEEFVQIEAQMSNLQYFMFFILNTYVTAPTNMGTQYKKWTHIPI